MRKSGLLGYATLFALVPREYVCGKQKPRGLRQRGVVKLALKLTLAELEAFASTRLTVLLAFFHSGIASEEAFSFQSGAKIYVDFEQSAGNSMPHRTRLSLRSASLNIDADIILGGGFSPRERRVDYATECFGRKIDLKRAAVYGDFARARCQTHARN